MGGMGGGGKRDGGKGGDMGAGKEGGRRVKRNEVTLEWKSEASFLEEYGYGGEQVARAAWQRLLDSSMPRQLVDGVVALLAVPVDLTTTPASQREAVALQTGALPWFSVGPPNRDTVAQAAAMAASSADGPTYLGSASADGPTFPGGASISSDGRITFTIGPNFDPATIEELLPGVSIATAFTRTAEGGDEDVDGTEDAATAEGGDGTEDAATREGGDGTEDAATREGSYLGLRRGFLR